MTTPDPAQEGLADQEYALRDLATELQKPELSFSPATIRKGIVTSVDTAGSPPTIGVQLSGDTSISVPGVRYVGSYSPYVGQIALILKQGTDIVALGEVTTAASGGGWTQASLSSGFTHGGNSFGNLEYRKVTDNGAIKMQWRGAVTRSANSLIAVVATEYRPSVRRAVLTARDEGGGSNVVRITFETSGDVNMIGGTTSPNDATANISNFQTTPGYEPKDTSGGVIGGVTTAHKHGLGEHGHNGSPHGHSVNNPAWICFDGVEYFL